MSNHHNNMEYNSHHMLLPSSAVLCYMDAAISPNGPSPQLRQAGIGIKFVNMQVQPPNAIYIKAIVKEVSSVVMAEAAALALAASTATNLGFMQVSFLTDSSQLYHFLLGSEQSHPPVGAESSPDTN
jgi:ribonuclease HI